MSSTTTPNTKIPIFAVGQSRVNAEAIAGIFQSPYYLAGILDTVSTAPYNFTPSNLALALRVLHPRPRAIIVGEAISSEDSANAVKTWKEFVEELEVENPLLIDVGLMLGVGWRE
jgi:hypothetical protein